MLVRAIYDTVIRPSDGALRLPDGTPVRPRVGVDARGAMSFDIRTNAQGETVIAGRVDIDGMNAVIDNRNGQWIYLVRGGELAYSAAVTVETDGSVRVSQPPKIEIDNFVRAPQGMPDKLETVLTDRAYEHVLTGFSEHMERQFARENVDFCLGVQDLKRTPTLASAQELFDRFVKAETLNITGKLGDELAEKLKTATASGAAADLDVLTGIFERARADVMNTMLNAAYGEYKLKQSANNPGKS